MDADVIFIGEIRDDETAKIACQAAQSGQLVLATMHANDSVSGALRLIDLGLDRHSIANSLRGVLAQTLVRKLCTECRVAYTPGSLELANCGMTGHEGELYRGPEPSLFQCVHCDGRGFLRRTGLYELLEINSGIRELLESHASPTAIASRAQESGALKLYEEGKALVRQGIISAEELQRVLGAE